MSIESDITKIGQKLFIGKFITCESEKSMAVSDEAIKVEGLGHLLHSIAKVFAKAGKIIDTILIKKPGRVLEIGARSGSKAVSRSLKAALCSIPDVMKFL